MATVSELTSKNIADTQANVRNWGRLVYNVREYGLVGDGVTDDTVNLQALIDLAILDGRKTIAFNSGVYYVTALTNADQVFFVGDNASFTGGYAGTIEQLGDIGASQAEFDAYKAETVKPIVSFTFDDGFEEDALTYSILKEFGFVGSFGLIGNTLYGTGKNSLNNYFQYEKEGFEVLSHTMIHLNMNTVYPTSTIDFEYEQSSKRLKGLGFTSNGVIVPNSIALADVYTRAKMYYDFILIGGTGLNGKHDFADKILTRVNQYSSGVEVSKTLIDQAIEENKLLIFYDHRIGAANSLTEADFREILTYLKTKTDAGLIEVYNTTNAISKYYGINPTQKLIPDADTNFSPEITDFLLTDVNTIGATKQADLLNNKVRLRINVPAAAAGEIDLYSSVVLPTSYQELGERIRVKFDIIGSNSQAEYFTNYLDIIFLDGSDVVLQTKSFDANMIYSTALHLRQVDATVFCDPGIDTTTIAKIKVQVRITIDTATTVPHIIYVSSMELLFPNKAYNKRDVSLYAKVSWDVASLADGAGETSADITVTGAELGDFVLVSAPIDLQGITATGYVSAANTVKIRVQNETGGVLDLATGTWRVKVIKK